MKKQHLDPHKVLIIITLMFSNGTIATATENHVHDSHHENSHENTTQFDHGLSLNEDRKWEMDDHTKSMFSKMANDFLNVDLSLKEKDELKSLATSLTIDLQDLINGCTMEGAAHDELHKFLMGFMTAVYDLQEYGSQEIATTVKKYLQIYPEYFE